MRPEYFPKVEPLGGPCQAEDEKRFQLFLLLIKTEKMSVILVVPGLKIEKGNRLLAKNAL
jgi:hypothetical protein